jgi:hypothetical protein
MKVICIDGNWNKGGWPMSTGPKEGEIVTVSEVTVCNNKPVYRILEYFYKTVFWEQENFIPLSEIDETALSETFDKRLFENAK